MVTKSDWQRWLEDPVTRLHYESVYKNREELLEALAHGVFESSPGLTNIMIGKINSYTKILDRVFPLPEQQPHEDENVNRDDD